MKIKIFPTKPLATNAYVASSSDSKEVVIIDPGLGSGPSISRYLDEQVLKPLAILLTHSHWDHIGGAADLKKRYQIPLWIHPEDEQNLNEPGADQLPLMMPIEGVEADKHFQDGQKIQLGELRFTVIHTPGHSPGGVCLYAEEEKILFSGDTLFHGSIGNLSFPTGEPERMWESLEKLSRLPKDTKVYPGHGEATTIGEENWLPYAKKIFKESLY